MIKILNMDCMDYLRKCNHNEFDLVIADPPYGINFAKSHTGKGWVVRESKDWDKEIPPAEYFELLKIISKNQIIWGGNYFVEHLQGSQGWIFWDKGQREFSLADGELAFTSFDRALRVFGMSRGAMQAEQGPIQKFHPTQKPIKLYEWLLTNYAEPGQKILDTHLGSGSSAIAAHYFGADFVGIEIDTDYYKSALARFEQETSQMDIFGDIPTKEISETIDMPLADWQDLTQVKKGNVGEALVEEHLRKQGKTIYKPVTDQAHLVDRIVTDKDKTNMVLVEIKSYAARKYYKDTGLNYEHFIEYREAQEKHNMPLEVYFVDEEKGQIYGGPLDEISKKCVANTSVKRPKLVLTYPLTSQCRTGRKIYFPLELMDYVADIPTSERNQLFEHTTKNDFYLQEGK